MSFLPKVVDLKRINASIIEKRVGAFEQKPISSLPIGKAFNIICMAICITRYGRSILMTLRDDNDTLFKSWLSKSISDEFDADSVRCINASDFKYTITYLGQSPQVAGSLRTRPLVEFNFIE